MFLFCLLLLFALLCDLAGAVSYDENVIVTRSRTIATSPSRRNIELAENGIYFVRVFAHKRNQLLSSFDSSVVRHFVQKNTYLLKFEEQHIGRRSVVESIRFLEPLQPSDKCKLDFNGGSCFRHFSNTHIFQ